MELLLLVAAIVILGIWTGWQEYRINKIQEDVDNNIERLGKHARAIYGEKGIFYRLCALEHDLRIREDRERVAHRKAAMKEYLSSDVVDDCDIDRLYDMSHGLSIDEIVRKEEEGDE